MTKATAVNQQAKYFVDRCGEKEEAEKAEAIIREYGA